ncbi:MAG: hypothetical protein JWP76_4531 [Dactylosporangium sp.]|nr:hypothetical protein [Dactylosporangium sp.]
MRPHSRILTAAAVAVLAATAAASDPGTENRGIENQSTQARSTGGRHDTNPPPGWRLESSLGAQIAVPDNWAVNDSGCGMTANPSVVRGKGLQTLCYTAEPPTKELAIIEDTPKPGGNTPKPSGNTPGTATTINKIPAQRGEKRLPDGRYAGWISVPSRRVTVDVRTRDPETTKRILRSLQLVDTDHLGCPTQPPKTAKTRTQNGFVPPDPKTITVCYYGGQDRLQASAEIKDAERDTETGDNAHRLAAMLNAAPPGGNPDRPAQTCDARADPPNPDAILLMRDSAVRIRFSTCGGRGMDNGARTVQVTRGVITTIMAPIHSGYSVSADLPA